MNILAGTTTRVARYRASFCCVSTLADVRRRGNSHDSWILVVEDEVLVRVTIADYLRECGFQVVEAGSADEALTILNSELPVDLIFSDVQMPGTMNGFGLARWIREHRADLKIILTSGWSDAAEEAKDLCDDGPLLAKPYDHPLLVERINRLLGTRERFRSHGAA